jgi:16S rRNA (guanine527-N7)-methyltransferase
MEDWQILLREKEFNDLLMEWNGKINLVSRKKGDVMDLIGESKLFFGKIDFKQGIKIFDLGTGGGFPGIVIAINHPEAEITMVDSIQKKITAVNDIIKKMQLTNARALCSRAEELATDKEHKYKYDYIVARSVAVLQDLAVWSRFLIKLGGKLITVKGGEIMGEINAAQKLRYVKKVEIEDKGDKRIVSVTF